MSHDSAEVDFFQGDVAVESLHVGVYHDIMDNTDIPERRRCAWVGEHPDYLRYHDEEWGVPLRDDVRLFEFLILEGAQAGLSWLTILRRREGYRCAFDHFDAEKIARYGEADTARLRADSGIVRNRLKIDAVITNARCFLELQRSYGSFYRFLCRFLDASPHRFTHEIPVYDEYAVSLSKDLKKRGFRFVGPTIVYAFMQAVGMVNDHTTDCFRHAEIEALSLFGDG